MRTNTTQFISFVFLLFVNSFDAHTQTERPQPPPDAIAVAPWWAQQMYAENPNIPQVDSACMLWRRDHPAEKTFYSQFYKHWRRAIGSNVSPKGFWSPPTAQEEDSRFQNWLKTCASNNRAAPVWESLGPDKTYAEGSGQEVSWQGNVYCLDQSLSDPQIVYCGTENGAIFKSENGGTHWFCVSNQLNLNGIGAVKVHPSDPNTVYFGQGNYVYKTTNSGATWNVVLTFGSLNISDISVNPGDPNIVLVAGNGLHRSTDGGISWTQLYTQKCWDIETKTDDPNTVFLLKTNPVTKLCEFYKSTDAGAYWSLKSTGWIDPSANGTGDNTDGGARLAVTKADPNRVYAILLGQYNDGLNDNNYLGLWRSGDAGESWTLPNKNSNGGPGAPYAGNHSCLVTFWFNDTHKYPDTYQYDQGFYNLGLDVSDTNPDQVLAGFLNLFKSTDGGATFERWGGYGGGPGWQHPDIQDIDINNGDVWVSSDGGINKYAADFSSHQATNSGLAASDFWGFDIGWNEDIMTGGRYHNGNTATIFGTYPDRQYIRLGGAEATTGYVHPAGGRKVMHSDINPKILPTTITGSTSGFSFTQYPNEGYAGNNENTSEIERDPRCYNHLYLGSENTLQKSTDGGLSWTTLYTFGNTVTNIVTGIEVSRSNPDVIYLVQNGGNSKLWKSTDGGQTFTQTATPPGAVSGAFIALSEADENKIWLAWNKGGNSTTKVFESTNGGASWTNLSTFTLDGHHIEQLIHIGGTDDGLYLASDFGIFYRSDSEADWLPAVDGLPTKTRSNRLLPFYAKNKVRLATYGRGIWQADFFENPSQPVVQPTVDKLNANCARDTFYFDDYSMVNHDGATWQWTFEPTPQYVSTTNVRNPKVVFGAPGDYTATMTLNGSFTKSLNLSVNAGCDAEQVPGNALSLDGGSSYAVANNNLHLNSNTVTITAWVKAAAVQKDRAVIVFARGGNTTAGLGFSSGTRLSYHWNDEQWWWDSGFDVPADIWTNVALVISPDEARIYLNGEPVSNAAAHAPEEFDTPLVLGFDNGDRFFTGLIDEVTVWNKSLTQDEIRELMHLTKVPADQPSLVSYYQFNETSGQVMDRVSVRHISLANNASRTTSTGPFGGGTSDRQTVNSAGIYAFGTTGVTMQFPENILYPHGELVVSRINLAPDQLPNAAPHSDAYWVVNNYGQFFFFDQPDFIRFDAYGEIPAGTPANNYQLFQRGAFDDGDTWGGLLAAADEVVSGPSGSVTFFQNNGVEFLGQFVIMNEPMTAVEWQDFKVALQPDNSVRLYWTVQQSPDVSHFILEKSADGTDFQFFKKINAQPDGGLRSYQTKDPEPFKGITFYRLRQIDASGRTTFSAVRSILTAALAEEWSVYPNPLSANQSLEIRTEMPGEYRFRLYNAAGKLMFEKKLRGDATLSGLDLAAGVYGYEVISASRRVKGKLVVVE